MKQEIHILGTKTVLNVTRVRQCDVPIPSITIWERNKDEWQLDYSENFHLGDITDIAEMCFHKRDEEPKETRGRYPGNITVKVAEDKEGTQFHHAEMPLSKSVALSGKIGHRTIQFDYVKGLWRMSYSSNLIKDINQVKGLKFVHFD